jgi:uncharacterized protein YecT (DUF1311 family)
MTYKNPLPLIALLSIFISSASFANKIPPIDKTNETCKEKNYSTLGMQECDAKAYKDWDAELNKIYKALREAQGSKPAKNALKASQLHWLKFRDSELNFINKMYQAQQGTYWGTVASSTKIALIRTRVQTLQADLASLSPENKL